MCRMFLFLGKEPAVASRLLETLVKASSRDDLLPEPGVRRRGHRRHPHGWGYVLLGKKGTEMFSLWEQRARPIYEDEDGTARALNAISRCDALVFIAHSRLASSGGTERHRCHPFHFQTAEGVEFFLAHNGSMQEEPLRQALPLPPRGASDTLLLGHWLAAKAVPFSVQGIAESFANAEPFTETAMNTFSLWLDGAGSGVVAHVTSHVTPAQRSEEMLRYFQLYSIKNERHEAWMSSTLAQLARVDHGIESEPMELETRALRHFEL